MFILIFFREQREKQSALQKYVQESLFRIAQETGKPMESMEVM